ncbi:MAG: hypothetical protein DCC50_14840, partial [Acidobacteria bacterium]
MLAGGDDLQLAGHPLTVRDVLELEQVQLGRPEVLAGHDRLDLPVRWVHVAESRTAARFLEGGEVVLTTGAHWPEGSELAAHVAGVLQAGAVAVFLELGTRFHAVPDPAVRVCQELGVPLVALHEQVQFVAVTESAHRRLVASRIAELEARDRIQALFTDLNEVGAAPSRVVSEVARVLAGPVVLEDAAHRVVSCAPHGRSEPEVLEQWSRRSRVLVGRGRTRVVDVAARGRRWGRMIALDVETSVAPSLVDLTLTQASLTLALGVVESAADGRNAWDAARHQRLLRMLLDRDLTSTGHALAALEAAGLVAEGRPLVALAWTVPRDEVTGRWPRPDDVRETASRVAAQLRTGLLCTDEPSVGGGYLALVSLDPAGAGRPEDRVGSFAAQLQAHLPLTDLVVGGVSMPDHDVADLLLALARARSLVEQGRGGGGPLPRPGPTELDLLLGHIPSVVLQSFVERTIGPVLTYDARHGSDLLTVLERYLEHPGNKTVAAREAHLSRSVFYQRLELLTSQLGHDLDSGSTLAAH